MLCKKCNRPLDDDDDFCGHCGARAERKQHETSAAEPDKAAIKKDVDVSSSAEGRKLEENRCADAKATAVAGKVSVIPDKKAKSKGFTLKKYAVIVTCISVLLVAILIITSVGIKPRSFASPEAAAEFFVSQVRRGRFDKAMDAFSHRARLEGFDFNEYISLNGTYAGTATPLPAEYDRYDPLNEAYLSSLSASQIKFFITSILLPEKFNKTTVVYVENSGLTPAELYVSLEPSDLNKLKMIEMRSVSEEIQNSENHQMMILESGKAYGYTETTEYLVLYKLGKSYYVGGMTISKYADGWYIDGLYSMLGKTSTLGTVTVSAKKDFEGMFS